MWRKIQDISVGDSACYTVEGAAADGLLPQLQYPLLLVSLQNQRVAAYTKLPTSLSSC